MSKTADEAWGNVLMSYRRDQEDEYLQTLREGVRADAREIAREEIEAVFEPTALQAEQEREIRPRPDLWDPPAPSEGEEGEVEHTKPCPLANFSYEVGSGEAIPDCTCQPEVEPVWYRTPKAGGGWCYYAHPNRPGPSEPLYSHETVQRLQRENRELHDSRQEARNEHRAAIREIARLQRERDSLRQLFRINIEKTDGGVRICDGWHDSDECQWEYYVPAERVAELRAKIAHLRDPENWEVYVDALGKDPVNRFAGHRLAVRYVGPPESEGESDE